MTSGSGSPGGARTSLFVLGLPRSFSSQTYEIARQALGLRQPTWTSAGEILNLDRMAPPQAADLGPLLKFSPAARDPTVAARIGSFLERVTEPQGWAYKDVVQPLVLSAWAGLGRFRVLKIHRDLVDVTFSMLKRGWFYPYAAASPELFPLFRTRYRLARVLRFLDPLGRVLRPSRLAGARLDEMAVRGIVLAHRALGSLEAETVEYEDLVGSETVLQGALGRLYPEAELPRLCYIDGDFQRRRDRVTRARRTRRYQEVQALVESVLGELH